MCIYVYAVDLHNTYTQQCIHQQHNNNSNKRTTTPKITYLSQQNTATTHKHTQHHLMVKRKTPLQQQHPQQNHLLVKTKGGLYTRAPLPIYPPLHKVLHLLFPPTPTSNILHKRFCCQQSRIVFTCVQEGVQVEKQGNAGGAGSTRWYTSMCKNNACVYVRAWESTNVCVHERAQMCVHGRAQTCVYVQNQHQLRTRLRTATTCPLLLYRLYRLYHNMLQCFAKCLFTANFQQPHHRC